MSDDADRLILGDAAVAAGMALRRRRFFARDRKVQPPPLPYCENCGADMHGAYCGLCGQHAVDYRRSFARVLVDALDSLLNWDTKFLSSMGVLLTRPWKLTNDFNRGRRVRYVHPLRLYLLASIAFFLLAKSIKIAPKDVIHVGPEDRAEIAADLGKVTVNAALTPEQREKIEAARQRLAQGDGALSEQEKSDVKEIITSTITSSIKDKLQRKEGLRVKRELDRLPPAPLPSPTDATSAVASADSSPPAIPDAPPNPNSGIHFTVDDTPKSPFEAWVLRQAKEKLGEDGSKAKFFIETLRRNIPTMMLFCIPLFALVLKLLYVRKRRYYIEHLVYALHIHTFVYVAVTVITLLGMGIAHFSNTARVLAVTALSIAVFAQVFLSIRRVYGQGWFVTTLKFLLGGFAYFVILVCAVSVTAFATLLLPD